MSNLIERIRGMLPERNGGTHRGNLEFLDELKQLKDQDPQTYLSIKRAIAEVERVDEEEKRRRIFYPLSETEDPENYIILEGTDSNLLIAKQKIHFSKNWYQAHEELHKEGSVMLTPRQFIDFVNLLDSDKKVYDGIGDKLSSRETKQILDEIRKKRNPWRSEWLDADFKTNEEGRLHINYNHQIVNEKLVPRSSEPLDLCLMKDCYADVFGSANRQGLPIKKDQNSGIYYWAPMKDNNSVARFYANSYRAILDCSRYPSNSYSALGVRSAKQRA